jgi:hypothetical protein
VLALLAAATAAVLTMDLPDVAVVRGWIAVPGSRDCFC